MRTITTEELLSFLLYLAEYEIVPRSGTSIHAVNFTLSEIRSAVAEMKQQGTMFQAYLKHTNRETANGPAGEI